MSSATPGCASGSTEDEAPGPSGGDVAGNEAEGTWTATHAKIEIDAELDDKLFERRNVPADRFSRSVWVIPPPYELDALLSSDSTDTSWPGTTRSTIQLSSPGLQPAAGFLDSAGAVTGRIRAGTRVGVLGATLRPESAQVGRSRALDDRGAARPARPRSFWPSLDGRPALSFPGRGHIPDRLAHPPATAAPDSLPRHPEVRLRRRRTNSSSGSSP